MPTVIEETHSPIRGGHPDARPRVSRPLEYSGSLDRYQNQDLTPVIGREYEGLQVAEILQSPDRDQLIQDLAATISSRGVVFLRNQDVTPQQMRDFAEKLTLLAGCPESSGLHVHPLTEEGSELGDQISVISSEKQKKGGGLTHQLSDVSRFASAGWHTDISFERVPSDYAMLKIHTLPETGGDTMWASGYEIYDRLSPEMASFLERLTATHDATFFHDEARRLGNPLRKGIRGSPLNQGDDLTAVHPVIRTNPVTGWKSVYVNKGFTKRINGVTKDESDVLLQYLFNLVTQNHDAQVRFKWRKNDLAIWDNRSTYHCATYDYAETRTGDRIIDIRSDKKGVELRKSLQQSIHNESAALPDLLLWDELGLKYFEDVTYCSSYHLTREEIGLLQTYCREIAARIPAGSMLVELGSGNLRKTKILLDALEELGRPVDYFALDVSYPELQRTLRPVSSGIYRHVRCFGLLGTYDDGRTWLQHPDLQSRPKTILYLGSTLGNFEKVDAAEFLASFAQADCSFLLGLDGCKDEERVLKAYNDPDGVNHRFVKNGLKHANRILGHEAFDLDKWRVAGDWDAEKGAHNQSYFPRVDVSLEGVQIPAGRKLLAVRSHKYDAEDRDALCKRAGLHVLDSWSSQNDYSK
ncbi:hypothetical protein BJX66DRAFT_328694 [Aspergillus keveii]|uniref:TauD/TfdA-like domain-containing protein n=1 Tax=Aspergillus keveii TaxID=714993 RepID=A0ABR4FSK5_9EURO